MVWFLKDHTYSKLPVLRRIAKGGLIGVDVGDDAVKMVQLANHGSTITLIAGGCKSQPEGVKTGTGKWQRWAIEAMHQMTANGKFHGRDVVAAMPAGELFIDHIKMPKVKDGAATHHKLQDAILAKIKQRLPFETADALMKYVPAEQNNLVVMAADRKIVDRHLAIYENANLQIKSIGVWPIALINSYTTFFGRRKSDFDTIVMLLGVDTNRTNVVICRHSNLLFARSIPIGAALLDNDDAATRLVLELTACRRHFGSMYKNAKIQRLIFLTGRANNKDIYAAIAKQLEMPAQIGDSLAAVKMADPVSSGIDRRDCQVNWATAFGLSLS
jgi:Tfp pilus assembly PilM family ATPase